jgi:hypothetical protein
LTLLLDGTPFLRTNLAGRFRRLSVGTLGVQVTLPPTAGRRDGTFWLEFPAYAGRTALAAHLAGKTVAVEAAATGLRVALPSSDAPAAFELALVGAG